MPEIIERVDQVSGRLAQWLARSAGGVATRFVEAFEADAPARPQTAEGRRVDVCFRALSRVRPERQGPAELEIFRVSYRVRAAGADPLENQRLYSEIFFAACEPDAEFTLDPSGGRADTDGLVPFIDLAGFVERRTPARRGPPVLGPQRLRVQGAAPLAGRVLDPGGRPVARAEVAAPELGRRAATDADGRFAIPGAPTRGMVRLRVVARGLARDVVVDAGATDETTIKLAMERDDA